jgi:hypothetical protein
MTEAMQKKGADAILIEHVGMAETGFTTVENKTKEKKSSGYRRQQGSPLPRSKETAS